MKTIPYRHFLPLLFLLFFGLLLGFPSKTLQGSSAGLLLWFQTLLPTLLPTMILADFLLKIQADRIITRIFALPFSLLFGLSKDACYGAIVGFLCGYPMGAKTAVSLVQEGRICLSEARYLLSFTNQPSPMFLVGFLCLGLFGDPNGNGPILPVLAGIYGSSFLVSILYRVTQRNRTGKSDFSDANAPVPTSPSKRNKSADLTPLANLESSMMTSFEVMVKIGGYMMLFSIVETHILGLHGLPEPLRYFLMGAVEMTTGCQQIATGLTCPWSLAFCSAFTAFGGLSGFAQTANILQNSGLSARSYFFWKLVQGTISGILVLLCIL